MVQVAQNILGLAVEDVIQNNLQNTLNRFLWANSCTFHSSVIGPWPDG